MHEEKIAGLRTGKSIAFLTGHKIPVLLLQFILVNSFSNLSLPDRSSCNNAGNTPISCYANNACTAATPSFFLALRPSRLSTPTPPGSRVVAGERWGKNMAALLIHTAHFSFLFLFFFFSLFPPHLINTSVFLLFLLSHQPHQAGGCGVTWLLASVNTLQCKY